MTSPLERTLFLVARCRLLLLEIQDIERQLRRLASGTSLDSEQHFADDALDALSETAVMGRSTRSRIEALVPEIEAEIEMRREGL